MTQEFKFSHLKMCLKSRKILEFSNGCFVVGDLYSMVTCEYDPETVYISAEAIEYFTIEFRNRKEETNE